MTLSNTATSVVARVTGVLFIPPPVLFTPLLAGTNLQLTWSAVSNVSYRLEYKTNLSDATWEVLPGDVTSQGNTATNQDSLNPGTRFYRVRVLP